jgi:hypothetical protein
MTNDEILRSNSVIQSELYKTKYQHVRIKSRKETALETLESGLKTLERELYSTSLAPLVIKMKHAVSVVRGERDDN